MQSETKRVEYILATDVGSTTTKARFFKWNGKRYQYVASGEAPTTVEKPYEDVTLGLKNSIKEIEDLTGYRILDERGRIIVPSNSGKGVDIYVSTSSAGGGLQMIVLGVIKIITAESAQRAALGAGAIVMDTISLDDGRTDYDRIETLQTLRPDIILLSGGTDGGTISHVLSLAEYIKSADPKPRLGTGYRLPILYCGNKDAREHIRNILAEKFDLYFVSNIRPKIDVENTEEARVAIHSLFMEHVMSHAPGYPKLMEMTSAPIMPTPAGEGKMMQLLAKQYNVNLLGVGLGGATTNIYSVYDGKFVRTVSANLGMSYSISNVMASVGVDKIMRWIPFELDEREFRNIVANKMIRPTTIPQTLEELAIEHAIAREAIRAGFTHHKTLARELKGVHRALGLEALYQRVEEETYIKMINVDLIVGTGGLLSHAPRRVQSMAILIDAFLPEGITRIFQDSVFMMPHLGVLSTVHEQAAIEIFEHDCVLKLGTVIAPKGEVHDGEKVLELVLTKKDGEIIRRTYEADNLDIIPLAEDEEASVELKPSRNLDVGCGPGKRVETKIYGGVVGIVIDTRGRPINFPLEAGRKKIIKWFSQLRMYPEDILNKWR
jgi:uncharacterized protein (TIGR01319 family)